MKHEGTVSDFETPGQLAQLTARCYINMLTLTMLTG